VNKDEENGNTTLQIRRKRRENTCNTALSPLTTIPLMSIKRATRRCYLTSYNPQSILLHSYCCIALLVFHRALQDGQVSAVHLGQDEEKEDVGLGLDRAVHV
jgi:hypothetical protein